MNNIVSIRLYCPYCTEIFGKFFSYLPDANENPHHEFEVVERNDRIIIDHNDKREILEANSPLEAYYLLEQYIYYRLFPKENENIVFHSAAIRHNKADMVILIMGGARCGKTTITLAALRSGYYIYLSEDCVGIAPSTFETIPFPRALRYRGQGEKAVYGLNGWKISYLKRYSLSLLEPPDSLMTPKSREPPPSLVIFPQFSNKCQSELRLLTGGETLAKLTNSCVNNLDFLRNKSLKLLKLLAQRLLAVEVAWNDPHQVVKEIQSLLEKTID